MMAKKDSGLVLIHGKEYKTVAKRVDEFRNKYPDWMIQVDIIQNTEEVVLMKCTISDSNGMPRATGYAEETRGSTNINRTSALENCETSCVGRALAFLGFGGTEIASANEVGKAELDNAFYNGIRTGRLIGKLKPSIDVIKKGIADSDYYTALEALYELTDEEKNAIWIAPTKGGPLTTVERDTMKSPEWKEVARQFFIDNPELRKSEG